MLITTIVEPYPPTSKCVILSRSALFAVESVGQILTVKAVNPLISSHGLYRLTALFAR